MRFVLERGLVLGSENGADFGAPYTDFTHGNVHAHVPGETVPLWPLVYHDCVLGMFHVLGVHNVDNPNGLAHRILDTMLCGYQCSVVVGKPEEWPRYRKPFVDTLCIDRWHARVGTAEMTNHCFLTDDLLVEKTEFATGDAIVCNYADEPRQVEGQTIPAQGYRIA
jgi:hypothetical protein